MEHLTKEQRYQMKAYLDCNQSKKFIAKALKVNLSTIYRELKRNSTKRGKYNPEYAQELADERKERFAKNRRFTEYIKKQVEKHIRDEQWSPEQIVGYYKKKNQPMVSHERIYAYIRKDKEEGGDLYKFLRHKLKHRKRVITHNNIRIKNRTSIDERPKNVEDRKEFGHFEMDLVLGKENKGVILTLIERKTRFFICRFLPDGKSAKGVVKAVIQELLPYKEFVKSITTDNGLEFSLHEEIAKKLDANIYFTHPYCSWEKGQIEYANKLLRQYYPKKEIINKEKTMKIKEIQRKINKRPRKILGFNKPVELFFNFINQKFAFAS